MFPRLFAAIAVGVCSFADAACGQSPLANGTGTSELEGSSYAVDTLGMIIDRAMPSPPPPPGLVRNPQPSAAAQASDLAGSLFEDATYRVGRAIEPVFGQGVEPEEVIDGDWFRVKDVEVAPFKAVCQIVITWEDGEVETGTAAFVGRRVLVTAGHCVFTNRHDGWARSIQVIPARKGPGKGPKVEPFGSDVCRYLAAPEEWIVSNGRNLEYDIAWLVLPSRLLHGRIDFHFGVRAATPDKLSRFNLFSAGYPDPDIHGYRMLRDFELDDQNVQHRLFHHFHDTLPGSSGSPLYLKTGRAYDILGVHSHTPVDPLGIYDWNTATRMTGDNVAKTRLYNQQYP